MAALTIRAVKIAVIGSAAVPVIGYTGKLSAASNANNDDNEEEGKKFIRACDIPLYRAAQTFDMKNLKEKKCEPNVVMASITQVRIFVTDIMEQIMNVCEMVKDKVETGMEHSRTTLDYVQTNPGELPRVAFISMATMGGFVLGYRRGKIRKIFYASVAGLSSAALCYPEDTVELTSELKEYIKTLFQDTFYDKEQMAKFRYGTGRGPKETAGTGDPGQSKEEDKDLYSTRS